MNSNKRQISPLALVRMVLVLMGTLSLLASTVTAQDEATPGGKVIVLPASGVVDQIAERRGMPFCRRELAREHGTDVAEKALRALLKARVVFGYPPLVEPTPCLVAQFEHTMYVGPDGAEVMTR